MGSELSLRDLRCLLVDGRTAEDPKMYTSYKQLATLRRPGLGARAAECKWAVHAPLPRCAQKPTHLLGPGPTRVRFVGLIACTSENDKTAYMHRHRILLACVCGQREVEAYWRGFASLEVFAPSKLWGLPM